MQCFEDVFSTHCNFDNFFLFFCVTFGLRDLVCYSFFFLIYLNYKNSKRPDIACCIVRHKSQAIITKYSFFLRSLSFHKKISQLMTTIRLRSSILRINTPLTTYAPKQEKYVNFNSKRTYRWCIKLFLVLSKMQENYRLLTPNHWAPRLTWGKKNRFLTMNLPVGCCLSGTSSTHSN